jgi:putative ABC transport system permease protein
MKAGTQLAWLQLAQKKGHVTAAVSGVAFAVALMFTQIGLLASLLNASVGRLYRTPIELIFAATVFLGLVLGGMVVYQVLYSDVTNRLPEYATMKAMGYSDRKLFRLVMIQAIFLSMIGFIPGIVLAEMLFVLLARAAFLPLAMTLPRALGVYGLTFLMCAISGASAMQAIRGADPAEIF